jgi:hypothetical protein
MKTLSPLARKNKRAVSLIISYVLLISIGIALSGLVYSWLRFYVSEDKTAECKEDTILTIRDYSCNETTLNITIKNKGKFSADGFVLRVHDRVNATQGLYTLYNDLVESKLAPNDDFSDSYDYTKIGDHVLTRLTLIEIQPFVINGEKIYCESVSSQVVDC